MAYRLRARTHALLSALVLAAACAGDTTGPDERYPGAAAQGINADLLDRAYADARATPGIRSLLVQRHGVLVAEEYFNGGAADSLEQVWSVTKSVMSILTGIALDRGELKSVNQTLAEFLPPLVDSLPADKSRITVRQLLTMTSGLQWHEMDGGGEYGRWVKSPDMIQYVVDLPWAHVPGTTFLYNTGGSHLVSVVLTQATGAPTLDYARRYLFGPLGIARVDWWQDNRGYFTGGMGLMLRPLDMVKLGELFLRDGLWGSTRVVSKAWVRESTAPFVSTNNAVPFGPQYAYSWWVGRGQGRDFYFANGYAGQFILISPALDLVVVATSAWRGHTWTSAGAQWSGVIDVVVNGVLPAVQP
jgi:CubicO group peptidase (beta-lactamase class C family)